MTIPTIPGAAFGRALDGDFPEQAPPRDFLESDIKRLAFDLVKAPCLVTFLNDEGVCIEMPSSVCNYIRSSCSDWMFDKHVPAGFYQMLKGWAISIHEYRITNAD